MTTLDITEPTASDLRSNSRHLAGPIGRVLRIKRTADDEASRVIQRELHGLAVGARPAITFSRLGPSNRYESRFPYHAAVTAQDTAVWSGSLSDRRLLPLGFRP